MSTISTVEIELRSWGRSVIAFLGPTPSAAREADSVAD